MNQIYQYKPGYGKKSSADQWVKNQINKANEMNRKKLIAEQDKLKTKQVYMYTHTGKLVKTFADCKEAAKYLNRSTVTVYNYLSIGDRGEKFDNKHILKRSKQCY